MDEFSVDLDHLDEVTQRIRGFKEFLVDRLAELDRQVNAIGPSWTGAAADAYQDAHRDWQSATKLVDDGLATLEATARRAHSNYSAAKAANAKMFGRGK